jgi:Dickkopf-like protein
VRAHGFPLTEALRQYTCSDMACDSLADICDPASKTCVGRIAVGGDCAVIPSGCVAYAHCDTATKTCVARKRAGEACAESSECLSGVPCTGGVCVPHPDVPACP